MFEKQKMQLQENQENGKGQEENEKYEGGKSTEKNEDLLLSGKH